MKNNKNKKILIVAYHFPPSSAVGGIRSAKFAKYLPEFGWEPIVLTILKKHIDHKDPERLVELNGTKIFRSGVWPTVPEIVVNIKKTFHKRKKNVENSFTKGRPITPHHSEREFSPERKIFYKIRRFIKSISSLPDEQIGWLFPAIWKGFRIIKKENIDIIFVSSPPDTSLVVGYVLSKISGKKLVIDLRDPCFSNLYKDLTFADRFSHSIEEFLGRKIMNHAEKIITITDEYREYLTEYYPPISKDKIFVIWNGYDKTDSVNIEKKREKNRFVISYIGTFYPGQDPIFFFRALCQLIEGKKIFEDEILIKFIGNVKRIDGKPLEDIVKKYKLDKVMRIKEKISYNDALMEMMNSDLLLVFNLKRHEYYIIPSKVFEILGLRKKIFCFTGKGATCNFLRKTGGATVVDPENVDEIKKGLLNSFAQWLNADEIIYNFDISVLERKKLTEKLVSVLETTIST